mgnify:CR=1 FL=1
MAADTVCTLVPYFKVKPGQLAAFKAGMAGFVERTKSEKGCVHYAFSSDGDAVHCREGYDDAAAMLIEHLQADQVRRGRRPPDRKSVV